MGTLKDAIKGSLPWPLRWLAGRVEARVIEYLANRFGTMALLVADKPATEQAILDLFEEIKH